MLRQNRSIMVVDTQLVKCQHEDVMSASLCVLFPVLLSSHYLFPVSTFSVSVSFIPVINAHLSHLSCCCLCV